MYFIISPWNLENPKVKVVHGILCLPFFILLVVPVLRNVVLHTFPTGYDKKGRCRNYLGPQIPPAETTNFLKELVRLDEVEALLEKARYAVASTMASLRNGQMGKASKNQLCKPWLPDLPEGRPKNVCDSPQWGMNRSNVANPRRKAPIWDGWSSFLVGPGKENPGCRASRDIYQPCNF